MARTKNHGNKGGCGGGGKAAQPAAKPAHLEIPSSMPSKFPPAVEVSLADAIAELKTIREEEWEEILPTCCLLLKERIAFLAPAAADAAASAPALASSIAPCGNHVGGASEESGMPRGPITPTYSEPTAEPSSGDTQDAVSRMAGSESSATPSVGSNDATITSAAGSSKSDSAAPESDEQDSRSEASSEATIKASEADKTYQGVEAQDEQGEEETSPQADNAKESLKIFIPVHKYPGVSTSSRHPASCSNALPLHANCEHSCCYLWTDFDPMALFDAEQDLPAISHAQTDLRPHPAPPLSQYKINGRHLGPRGLTLKN